MQLHLSLLQPHDRASQDVAVMVEPDHTTAELAAALADFCGHSLAPLVSVRRDRSWLALDPEARVGDVGLVSGDQVMLGARRKTAHSAAGVVRLAITSGPDAGASFPLEPGSYLLGRSKDVPLTVTDPLVSRSQLSVVVDPAGQVQIGPNPDARNEVRIDGQPVEGHAALTKDQTLQVGATSVRIREPISVRTRPAGVFGVIPFHRTPYFRRPLPEANFAPLGDLPARPKPKRFQFLAAASPVVMGVAMAFMIGNMRFLLMAAFSPLIALGSWLDQRKQGGRDYADNVKAFGTRVSERTSELAAAAGVERAARLHNHPDLELLARRADSHHNELWQRDRFASDFLHLRLGVGADASTSTIEPEISGDEDYRQQVADAAEAFASLPDVPIGIDLAELGALAIVGDGSDIAAATSALLAQITCLHSPEDVVVVGAVSPDRGMHGWLKWLPHVSAVSSPIGGSHLSAGAADATDLLQRVAKVVEQRASSTDTQLDRRWPWLVVAIDRQLEPDASVVSRILDAGPKAGVSVIWMTDSHARVPRQANAVVHCAPLRSAEQSEVRFVDGDRPARMFDPERLNAENAARIGRALAPMRDATASNAVTAIPGIVPLFASLGVSSMSADWIAQQWDVDRGYALVAPIGLSDSGPVTLNLVEHGPHGLIGGTSGAGKSELVQSLVVNLAALNSPERINFLFVDYKGGALSEMFMPLPHTVGAVTNLDALLALRALTSLTAELDRRMELFKGRATDIKEMLEKFPDEAPASLVIVVDEFAALVRELPEFVDGIVSIAERGRSLGIHLLMSTQRPSGAINDNIQQNTNLRIALRMLDSGESNNVIGTPDAAMIPVPLKGRGLARLGPGELIPFQSAWSGAPLMAEEGPPPVQVRAFGGPGSSPSGGSSASSSSGPKRTQLDVTIEAIVQAAADLNVARGRAPWLEVLPDVISLPEVLDDPRSVVVAAGRPGAPLDQLTIGMIDDPASQDQYPGGVDFGAGALAIFGNGGSGKSTMLKSIALSAAYRDSQAGGGGLTVFVLDFASRALGLLSRLPQTAAVAAGDDLEKVTRVLAILDEQMERRRGLLADAASSGELTPDFSRVLVLLDAYENLTQVFEASGSGRNMQHWSDVMNRLIVDGRQFGINVAFTAGRRGAVRANVMSAITNRFVLRQSDDSSYVELGVPSKMARGLELSPGQVFNGDHQLMRVASMFEATESGPDDRGPILEMIESLRGTVADEFVTQSLPDEIAGPAVTQLAPDLDGRRIRLGLADRSLAPVTLDLRYNNVAVLGPPRSGRSTALFTAGQQLISAGEQVWAIGPAGSPLAHLDGVESSAFGRAQALVPLAEELATAVEAFPDVARTLLFDDVDLADDRELHDSFQQIIDGDVRIIGSVTSLRGFGSNPMYTEMKAARTQLVLQPEGPREVQEALGVLPDMRPGVPMPVGRGVLIADRLPTVVQLSFPTGAKGNGLDPAFTEPAAVAGFVQELRRPGDAPTPLPAAYGEHGLPKADHDPVGTSVAQPGCELVLVLESGEQVTLDAPVAVGRRPRRETGYRTVALDDPYLSANHLTVEARDDHYVVTDQGSRNGTTLRAEEGAWLPLAPGVPYAIADGFDIMAGSFTLHVASVNGRHGV